MNSFLAILFGILLVLHRTEGDDDDTPCDGQLQVKEHTETNGTVSMKINPYVSECTWKVIIPADKWLKFTMIKLDDKLAQDLSLSFRVKPENEQYYSRTSYAWNIEQNEVYYLKGYDKSAEVLVRIVSRTENFIQNIEFKYEVFTLSKGECTETTNIDDNEIILLPYSKFVLLEDDQLGCDILLTSSKKKLGYGTIRVHREINEAYVSIFDGVNEKNKLLTSVNSSQERFFKPSTDSIFVSFRFSNNSDFIPVSKFNGIRLKIVVANDCEIEQFLCNWSLEKGTPELTWVSDKKASILVAAAGIAGSVTSIRSPVFTTDGEGICAEIEFAMSAYAFFFIFVDEKTKNETNLKAIYSNVHGFRKENFEIPSNSKGYVRLVLIENKISEKDIGILEVSYIRRSQGNACKKRNVFWGNEDLSWTPDYSGTDLFERYKKFIGTTLPYPGSYAKVQSSTIETNQSGRCLHVHYLGNYIKLYRFLEDKSIINSDVLKYSTSYENRKRIWHTFSLNETDPFRLTLEGMYTGQKNELQSIILFETLLKDGYCTLDCNFNSGLCAWLTSKYYGIRWTKGNLEFLHSYGENKTINEIISPLIWEIQDWFCLTFSLGSIPHMCLTVGVYNVYKEELILMNHCGPNWNFTENCVKLPKSRPFKIFIRSEGEGKLADDNLIPFAYNNINISETRTTSECDANKENCVWTGWNSKVSEPVVWSVVSQNELIAQRSCCVPKTPGSKGYIWSSNLISQKGEVCLTFSYKSMRIKTRRYHDISVCKYLERENGYGTILPASKGTEFSSLKYTYGSCNTRDDEKIPIFPRRETISGMEILLNFPQNSIWSRDIPPEEDISIGKVAVTLHLDKSFKKLGFAADLSRRNLSITDLKVSQGGCGESFNCDFNENMCDWSSKSQNLYSFNWAHSSIYQERASKTGPIVDCFLGPGGLIFANSSLEGDSSELISSIIPNGLQCVSFCYHMFGADIDKLEVHVTSMDQETAIWSKEGNQGILWHRVQLPIDIVWKYRRVKFVTFRKPKTISDNMYIGDIVLGDIALDSVAIRKGPCVLEDRIVDIPKI